MNIRRRADDYRAQLRAAGNRARQEVQDAVSGVKNHADVIWIQSAQCYLRGWFVKLRRALGDENDLMELWMSWKALSLANQLVRVTAKSGDSVVHAENIKTAQRLVIEAQGRLEKFLQKLPWIIEKSLTRAVRTSGIKLR